MTLKASKRKNITSYVATKVRKYPIPTNLILFILLFPLQVNFVINLDIKVLEGQSATK